jgi:hypothetical protein
LKAAIETTTFQLFERVVIFDGVEVDTKYRCSTIQKIELPIICSIADLHQILLRFLPFNPMGRMAFALNIDACNGERMIKPWRFKK